MSTIGEDALRILVTEAIYKGIEEKKRDELLKGAIESLLAPQNTGSSSYYADKRSTLQKAYDDAIAGIAREEVKKVLIENRGIREKIEGVILQSFDKVLANTDLRDQLITNLSLGIANAFKVKDSY